jgi:hypothetical protein
MCCFDHWPSTHNDTEYRVKNSPGHPHRTFGLTQHTLFFSALCTHSGRARRESMTDNKLSQIRGAIAAARQQEQQTHQLELYLASLAPRLHKAITLPKDQPAAALLGFVIGYIEHAPDFLEALDREMKRNNLATYGRVFLDIAEDFFLQPPEVVHRDGGLRALIDEAYLTHRLIEEINDRLVMLCGTPLVPMDTTMANIVVHQLLGEHFANQLDLAVHYAVEALFQVDQLTGNSQLAQFVAQRTHTDWSRDPAHWPCLVEDSSILLKFAGPEQMTEH